MKDKYPDCTEPAQFKQDKAEVASGNLEIATLRAEVDAGREARDAAGIVGFDLPGTITMLSKENATLRAQLAEAVKVKAAALYQHDLALQERDQLRTQITNAQNALGNMQGLADALSDALATLACIGGGPDTRPPSIHESRAMAYDAHLRLDPVLFKFDAYQQQNVCPRCGAHKAQQATEWKDSENFLRRDHCAVCGAPKERPRE
jgi:hypothetical protein